MIHYFFSFSFFPLWRCGPTRAMASSFLRFLAHTQRRITVARTPLDASASQRSLPDNTQHSQQTDIHVPGGIRTHSLSRRAVVDLSLRPGSHWDQLWYTIPVLNISLHCFGSFQLN